MTNGYKNECDFARTINRKKFCNLNDHMKKFIVFVFNDVNDSDVLECKRYRSQDKADVYIKLNGKIKNVSIKSGTRVSVHAERVDSFVSFLRKNKISENIIKFLLIYHFGDFTTNGTGSVRLPAKDLKIKYAKEIKTFNKYMNYNNIIKKITIRCLFEGESKYNSADYIYYGDVLNGIYASRSEVIDYFCNNKALEIIAPHISFLIYQNWNRNILYNKKLESHRYYCQFKWPSISEDLQNIKNQRESI